MNTTLVPVLVPVITLCASIVLSLLIELLPGFARWWDTVPAAYKRAYRGWAGLLIAVVASIVLYVLGELALDLTTLQGWLQAVLNILTAWVAFALGGETTYASAKPYLPRKQ